ncbi:MAG TPA: hypothetical protein VFJ94_15640 [Intrasporangium sp.]|uniref:hypothetical protein n=1 Tax=Intrasporangium sp. TaxID=1925024 RepID=UPI002D793275|nr:hypothetical protein [Intrasporangium sp.]HET7399947.1 hypothetical protein [Intrasporangium sp.]
MSQDSYRVIVVRARRDSGRLIIRILTGSGPSAPARQWVVADVAGAVQLIAVLLHELDDGSAPPTEPGEPPLTAVPRSRTPEATQD